MPTFLFSAEEFFEKCLEIIDAATEKIQIQTYILKGPEESQYLQKFFDVLSFAQKRGVIVEIVADAFGSYDLKKTLSSPIPLLFFNPFWDHWGRRLHHKVIFVDSKKAIVGGINLGSLLDDKEKNWIDFAIFLEDLPCLEDLQHILDFYAQSCQKFSLEKWKKQGLRPQKIRHSTPMAGIVCNDWMRGVRGIEKSYLRHIRKAKKSILLINGYFMPETRILYALYQAKKRKVSVDIILSEHTDIWAFHYVQKILIKTLLKKGIRVFLWEKSILHGKLALIDEEYLTIGSFNLNYIAHYADIEMNVESEDALFVKTVKNRLWHMCQENTKEQKTDDYRHQFLYIPFYLLFLIIRWVSLLFVDCQEKRNSRK